MNAIRLNSDSSAPEGCDGEEGSRRLAIHGSAMQRVRTLAKKVAPSSLSVLILGECGVGKDVLARMIHRSSPRAAKPFVAINCASISESLLAAELFGHAPGAFTGAASRGKVGLIESAQGGTVFLDEIGDMPLSMQAAMLRVIETLEVRPVMATQTQRVDVRFLAATNKDLAIAVENGEFRSDLMYRLNTMTLPIPPLRQRTDEIADLAAGFVESAARAARRGGCPTISAEVIEWLQGHRWPGNIRELKNLMECAVILADGPEIRLEHLPLIDVEDHRDTSGRARLANDVVPTGPFDEPGGDERQRIITALLACNGNQTRAARLLQISRRTFVTKLDRYQVPRPQKKTGPRLVTVDDGRQCHQSIAGFA